MLLPRPDRLRHHIPAQALTGDISPWLPLTALALLLTRAYWRHALRSYTSASS